MIVLIDNYDSFVYNLARYFERLGQRVHVVRNDAIDAPGIAALPVGRGALPGPCTPQQAGCSLDVVRTLAPHFPILGVCLGHQAIGAAFGGQIVRAAEPMHGRTSEILHDGQNVFRDIQNPFVACRYHSLIIERATLPDCLQPTAWTADGTLMAVAHRRWPVVGLQFHPESILTEVGYDLLAGFLRVAGLAVPRSIPDMASELVQPRARAPVPIGPVTF